MRPGGEDKQNVDLVRRHYEAFNRNDLDGIAATLHPEVELFSGDELGGAGERYGGRDDVMKFFAEIKQLVADNTIEVLSMEAKADRVESSVRLRGMLRSSELTGSLPALHFFTIRDGLIARIETYRPDWRRGI